MIGRVASVRDATAQDEQVGELPLGERPRGDGTRASTERVRLIVVGSAGTVLGTAACVVGEVCPFHRNPPGVWGYPKGRPLGNRHTPHMGDSGGLSVPLARRL